MQFTLRIKYNHNYEQKNSTNQEAIWQVLLKYPPLFTHRFGVNRGSAATKNKE
jgi:hypothetical protein